MKALCWSKTFDRTSSPDSTLSTSLYCEMKREPPARVIGENTGLFSNLFMCHRCVNRLALSSFLPIEAFAGGHQSLVEVRQGTGPLFDCLEIQGIAALQVVVRDCAQPVRCWSTCTNPKKRLISPHCTSKLTLLLYLWTGLICVVFTDIIILWMKVMIIEPCRKAVQLII